jgi:hypothetical protein
MLLAEFKYNTALQLRNPLKKLLLLRRFLKILRKLLWKKY